MGIANYHVKGTTNNWFVEHDGRAEGSYERKESAFEAAVAAASLACRQGHQVTVTVPGAANGESTTGAAANG